MVARSSARVLVVERDDGLRRTTAEVLTAAGHQVREASDVPGALAAAADAWPNVALVHVGLPDGWTLVRALRTDPRTCACPIVAIGGRPITAYTGEPMLAEVEAYLLKPCDPDFMLAVVTGALGGGGVASRASRELGAIDVDT